MRVKKITVHFIAVLDLTMFISQQVEKPEQGTEYFQN